MDISGLINKVYGVIPEAAVKPLEAIVDIGGQTMPMISGAMNWYKFRKINKELYHLTEQISTVTGKLVDSENEVFIKQEVFPIILNKITEVYVKPLVNARKPYKLTLNPIRLNIQRTEEEKERVDLERYMDNKLHRLGILEYAKERTINEEYRYSGITEYNQIGNKKDYEVNVERFEISNFGLRFVQFFYKEDTAD